MFRRTLFTATVVGAAVGGPYAVSHWPQFKAKVLGQPSAAAAANPASSTWADSATSANSDAGATQYDPRLGPNPKSDETPIVGMAEAFRLDVTPNWVMSRWPRVSSNSQAEQFHGMRVALITGTHEDDLAGSLTYYFNAAQKCAEITFTGTTGEPGRLINLMISRFGFKPYGNNDPGVLRYETRWNGTTLSELTIHSAPVIHSSAPFARYKIQLLLVNTDAR